MQVGDDFAVPLLRRGVWPTLLHRRLREAHSCRRRCWPTGRSGCRWLPPHDGGFGSCRDRPPSVFYRYRKRRTLLRIAADFSRGRNPSPATVAAVQMTAASRRRRPTAYPLLPCHVSVDPALLRRWFDQLAEPLVDFRREVDRAAKHTHTHTHTH